MSSLFGIGANGAASSFYGGIVTQSVRFNQPSSSYLYKSVSDGTRTKSTFAWWMKRGQSTIGPYNIGEIFCFGGSGGGASQSSGRITLEANKLHVAQEDNNSTTWDLQTTQLLRDHSSWYHCVVVIDTTQSTAADRVKVYINGNKVTSFSTASYPSQNSSTRFGLNGVNKVGVSEASGSPWSATYFDGYFSDMYYLDGVAVSDSSDVISEFGEFKNGVWIPIEYTGSYGTNGFRLQFNQTGTGTASSSTIGADTSGNTNHYTSSGIVASDCDMPDSPENNFATLNPLFATAVANTFSEGNLKVATSSSGRPSIASSFVMPTGTGKWFFEARVSGNGGGVGIMRTDAPYNNDFYYGDYQWSIYSHSVIHNGASVGSLTGSATYPEVYGLMLDTDTDTLKVYVGGSEVGSFSVDAGYDYYPISGDGSGAISITSQFNFGQDSTFQGDETAGGNVDANSIGDFSMTVPTGALALCTDNLPEPTISPNAGTQADDYFSPTLYTSDNIGAGGTQSVTGVGFQPDWVWIKNRSSSGTAHTLFDSVRTAGKMLQSDGSGAEVSNSQYGYLSSFDTDGFTLTGGTTNANFINQGTDAYVSWNWKAGGTAVSNTDGSITSSVSANTDAGFSIVTYNIGSSGVKTVGHGLTKAPELIINKGRDSSSAWWTFTTVIDGTVDYVRLDDTTAKANDSLLSVPTSSVFSQVENYTLQQNVVSYCFHSVEGYSKIGSYTGNGSTDGTFVYTGFRPAWVMIKRTDNVDNWVIFDIERDTHNVVQNILKPNLSSAESTEGGAILDFVSNGFKLKGDNAVSGVGQTNKNTGTYIYMAFAENPFKYANAR